MPGQDRTGDTRVVVTGIGLVTPLGGDRETSWRRLVASGRAGRWLSPHELDPADGSWPHSLPDVTHFSGAPAAKSTASRASRFVDPVTGLALKAAREAAADARLPDERIDPTRIGCVIGTSKGGLRSYAQAARGAAVAAGIADAPAAELWSAFLPHAAASAVGAEFGIGGPLLSPVAACATGLLSLNRGVELVRDGACDVVLAGSSDASLVPAVLASFRRLGVLASGFPPDRACRPFDRDRDGFLIGEGAAVLVLERLGGAVERGAVPYAEWLAGGAATDPTGLTQLDARAECLSRLIAETIDAAMLSPAGIDYANLHGTGTAQNDVCETRALRAALGPAADRLSASSLKGAIGHLLGAAGSVETACAILALRDRVVPPTVNLDRGDPECDLDYTPGRARRRPLETVLKLSLGFGGHLAAAVIRRFDGGRGARL